MARRYCGRVTAEVTKSHNVPQGMAEYMVRLSLSKGSVRGPSVPTYTRTVIVPNTGVMDVDNTEAARRAIVDTLLDQVVLAPTVCPHCGGSGSMLPEVDFTAALRAAAKCEGSRLVVVTKKGAL